MTPRRRGGRAIPSYSAANRTAAKIILDEIEQYGEESIMVRWAREVLKQDDDILFLTSEQDKIKLASGTTRRLIPGEPEILPESGAGALLSGPPASLVRSDA